LGVEDRADALQVLEQSDVLVSDELLDRLAGLQRFDQDRGPDRLRDVRAPVSAKRPLADTKGFSEVFLRGATREQVLNPRTRRVFADRAPRVLRPRTTAAPGSPTHAHNDSAQPAALQHGRDGTRATRAHAHAQACELFFFWRGHFDGNEVCEGLESVWLLVERIEQRLRLSQIGRVEAFREPAVDRREQVASFGAPTLVVAEPGEARGGAQFPELALLLPGDA